MPQLCFPSFLLCEKNIYTHSVSKYLSSFNGGYIFCIIPEHEMRGSSQMCPPSQNFGVGLKKTTPGASKSSASVAGGKFQGANGRLLEWAVSAPKITRPPRKCILRAQFQSNCWRCSKQPTIPKKKTDKAHNYLFIHRHKPIRRTQFHD
jgi:hypothetical protein